MEARRDPRRRPHRPLPIRLLNAAGRTASRLGLRRLSLEEADLLEAARVAAGLDDFGPESFRAGLRRLLAALEAESGLTPTGWVGVRASTVGDLVKRLRIVDHRKRHPEVGEGAIRAPLFVIGLPRTGTTLLYGLLAQDPAHRAPLSWEVAAPCPPPEADSYETDPRIELAERAFDRLRRLAPGFEAVHPIGARLPQECLLIHMLDFHSIQFHVSYNVPSYQAWLERQDLRPTYRFHRWFLQHLQSRCPGERWLLKSPAHLLALDVLLRTYPDARIVQTHRDPLEVMASVSSLHCLMRGLASDAVDPHEVGRQQVALWERLLARSTAVRDSLSDEAERCFDVQYAALVADPIGCVRGIYAHFGLPLGAEAESRMRRFLAENPGDKHGVHRYAPEWFGLDPERTARRFDGYCERFGVERKAGAPARGEELHG